MEAGFALALFENGTPIADVLAMHPLSYYDQHTSAVWQVVFEKYANAILEIDRKEIYAQFAKAEQQLKEELRPDCLAKSIATLAVMHLIRRTEHPNNWGLSLDEVSKILVDCLRHPLLKKAMRDSAQWFLNMRTKINDENVPQHRIQAWVDQTKTVKDLVDKLFSDSESVTEGKVE